MTKGRNLRQDEIMEIMVSMFKTNNLSATSRETGHPINTVKKIYDENVTKEEFLELRKKRNDEFIMNASRIVDKAMARLERQIEDEETTIPINQLTTAIGTIYDKRALAQGQPTTNSAITLEEVLAKVKDAESEY